VKNQARVLFQSLTTNTEADVAVIPHLIGPRPAARVVLAGRAPTSRRAGDARRVVGAPALPDNLRALLARLRATAPADVTDDDLAHAEFVGARQWKLAHRHGLRIAPGA
jgi:hypothetical protein